MRGKLTVFSKPELEVIDLAPEENEPEKKEGWREEKFLLGEQGC